MQKKRIPNKITLNSVMHTHTNRTYCYYSKYTFLPLSEIQLNIFPILKNYKKLPLGN